MTTKLRPTLGFDIGGANLKAAHTDGTARTVPFALWKQPEGLTEKLRELFRQMPPAEEVAITMTGELCDCYAHRKEGVHRILEAAEAAFLGEGKRKKEKGGGLLIWQTTGRFCSVEEAKESWLKTASANWLATATWAGRFVPKGWGMLIDVGSTTTDLVPILGGVPVVDARDDHARLISCGLLYAGVRRTPLHAVLTPESLEEAELFGLVIPERFAATLDVYVLLGDIPEAADDLDTADGRPRTKAHAEQRLLRMLGLDASTVAEDQAGLARTLAETAKNDQLTMIQDHVGVLMHALWAADDEADDPAPTTFLLAGGGEFLARQALRALSKRVGRKIAKIISLAEKLGPDLSTAAAAYAVAVLAAERP